MKLNTVVWGFCGSIGKQIIDKLKNSLNIDYWVSDQEGSFNIRRFKYKDIPLVSFNSEAVIFAGSLYKEFFNHFIILVTRRGLNNSDLHELTNEFYLTCYYFYELLVRLKTDLVIFGNIPHEGHDYILYEVSKKLGIKTLACYQNIFPNQFFLMTNIDDFGYFKTIPAICSYPNISFEPGYKQSAFYMESVEKQQDQEKKNQKNIFYKIRAEISKELRSAKTFISLFIKDINLIIKERRINSFDKLSFFYNIINLKKLEELYNGCLNNNVIKRADLQDILNSSKRLVYFPLHMQPELTTSAIGGVFQDQIYAIESLRRLLGNEWIILVKENPNQTHFQRGNLFFKRLLNINNLYLIDKYYPSVDLTEKTAFTATITGTPGWEAIKGGGKCLCFGRPWYLGLSNCLSYSSTLKYSELNAFLLKKNSIEEFNESVTSLFKKSGYGVTDPLYNLIVNDFDECKNADYVADTLINIIRNPLTIWN